MKLQRGQHGEVNSVYDFNTSSGQHGDGVYFFPVNNAAMRSYYTKNGENLHTAEIHDSLVLDCSKKKVDYWEARKIMFDNPDKKAFIFQHKGIGIPTGKEIVVTALYPVVLQKSSL